MLGDFFKIAGYDWRADAEVIKHICYFTKTRARSNYSGNFEFSYGMEQPFAIKAMVDWMSVSSMFEIGTGRGTSCYVASVSDSISKIDTIDIIPFDHSRQEAIGHKPTFVSNEDLYQMISLETKDKISFHHRNDVPSIISKDDKFDMFFIDGNHTEYEVIFEDFLICQTMSHDESIFIFDDYDPNKFAVKEVVNAVQSKWPSYQGFLLSTRGHIFSDKRPMELGSGMVVLRKGGFKL